MKRADIITAMQTRFQAIRTTDPVPYHTDLGLHVFAGKTMPFDENEVPGISIMDVGRQLLDEKIDQTGNVQDHLLECEIKLECAGGTALATLRQMIADVYRAIAIDDKWGGLAHQTLDGGDRLDVDQEDRKIGGAIITVFVHYRTTRFGED